MLKRIGWVVVMGFLGIGIAQADEVKTNVVAPAQLDFAVKSTAAAADGPLPVMYTCDGANISPQVSWSNDPSATESFALVLSDPDAPNGTFYHWIVYNIPKTVMKLEVSAALPDGALAGKNSAGKMEYNGPCPPKGGSHHYVITVYALNTILKLPAGADFNTLMTEMKDHILTQADYRVVYSRWDK